MIKVENISVWGFEHAIRGMRAPMQSWSKSDSGYIASGKRYENVDYVVGQRDLELMRKLVRAGSEHRKFLRQIFVSMDITTNHTVWAELDTYKVGVTRNSCSKMHTIHKKEFTIDDFTHENTDQIPLIEEHMENTIETLNALRDKYLETNDKMYWRAMIDILPMSYNLKATVTMNYENVLNIIRQRSGHKMSEWSEFVGILKRLPYMNTLSMS